MISLRGVRKAYSSETSIGPVDLDIPAGGITALVGPNGAGKSTLLTMIGRLMGMDDGQMPLHWVVKGLGEHEKAEQLQRERALLYVAASRARESLLITSTGRLSELVPGT